MPLTTGSRNNARTPHMVATRPTSNENGPPVLRQKEVHPDADQDGRRFIKLALKPCIQIFISSGVNQTKGIFQVNSACCAQALDKVGIIEPGLDVVT